MKKAAWFIAGSIFGVLVLLGIQSISSSTPPAVRSRSFEDLKIAVAATPTPEPVQRVSSEYSPPSNSQPRSFTGGSGKVVQVPTRPLPPTVQPVVTAPAFIPVVAPTPVNREEVSVFLDRRQQINTRFGSYRIYVHDHGSETISVAIGYGLSTRIKKVSGTDTVGDNKTLIHSDQSVRLYYVNTPRAPQNCCLIEVAPAS